MKKIVRKELCTGCEACVNICPKQCIKMVMDERGFFFPKIEEGKCISCGECGTVCPGYNENRQKGTFIGAYSCINKDRDRVMSSSSGGVFVALAEHIIRQDGIVYGVGWTDAGKVCHKRVTKLDGIADLQGSKYIQSVIGNVFCQTKKDLDNGHKILFVGTACQIVGLKNYLKQDYSELVCVDFACHGVPSPGLWAKYYRMKKGNHRTAQINFRDKEESWISYDVVFAYDHGTVERQKQWDDLYMRAFLKNLSLRECCCNCKMKGIERVSDLTLADYWGIWKQEPRLKDSKGVSLVLSHTEKGDRLLNECHYSLRCAKTDVKEAVKYNSTLIVSGKKNKKVERFWDEYQKNDDIMSLLKKYTRDSLMEKCVNMGIAVAKKIKK